MSPHTPLLAPETYFEERPNDTTLWAGVVFVGYVLAQILMTVSLFYLFIGQVENRPPAFDRAVADVMGSVFPVIIVTFVVSSSPAEWWSASARSSSASPERRTAPQYPVPTYWPTRFPLSSSSTNATAKSSIVM